MTATHNRRGPVTYGNGQTAATPIEGAARAGYFDAATRRLFSEEYATQTGQWQRNYEAGRQWATAILAIGAIPEDWPADTKTPQTILNQLAEVRRVTGSGTRPEDNTPLPDSDAPLYAIVPTIRRGRLIERIAQ